MRIKELYIKAFGRFADKRIILGDNFNIVYGLNEKGKSTIQKFIEAMFFGFVKPGLKRRVMAEEYDLYRPWTGELYGGNMVYEVGGRLFKAERNLEKGRESVRVFDHISGGDITGSFGYDKARREVLFAREHLGLSQRAYKNTVSISQLGSKSDSDLAREIQTRLGNLGSTGDANLSVGRAEKLIREYLDGIGTERAQTKEYGRLCRQIGELEEGLEQAAAAVESIRSSGRQLRDTEKEASALRAEREELERRIKACEDSALLARWAVVKGLLQEKEDLAVRLEECGKYRGFDAADSGELFALAQMADQDRREVNKVRLKIEETNRDIDGITEEISRARGGDEGDGGFIGSFILCAICAAAAIGTVLVAAVLENPSLNMLLVPLLALFGYSAVRVVRQRRLLGERKGAVRALVTEKQYMERYRDDLLASLAVREKELALREQSISDILDKSGSSGIEDYRERAAGFERYTRLKNCLEQTERLLEMRLDGESADALEERARAVEVAGTQPSGVAAGEPPAAAAPAEEPAGETAEESAGNCREQLEDWKALLQSIREEETYLLAVMEKTRGGIEALEQTIADLPEMEEELSAARGRLWHLKKEREAAEIALETIREASAGVHREFAPALNRKVSEITSQVTGGRYTDIQITKNLEIMATAPETGRRVESELLSGGTIDQLYFSLRIATAELLSGGSKLPLILDDCFVQYDARRLENVMEYLLEQSRERQIILFTCHHREKQVADALGEVYNYLIID